MVDWFNDNLSDYINKKERIIIDTRKNDKFCQLSSIISGVFFTLLIMFFITVFSITIVALINGKPDFIVTLPVAMFCLLCGYPLVSWLIYNSQRSARYVLTNCGIYQISGLIFKNVKFVAYNQITDVSMSKGPIQSIFNVGSVGVGTASGNIVGSVSDGNGYISSKNELDIDSVDNYKEIKEIIITNRKNS